MGLKVPEHRRFKSAMSILKSALGTQSQTQLPSRRDRLEPTFMHSSPDGDKIMQTLELPKNSLKSIVAFAGG